METTVNAQGQTVTSVVDYSDYTKVGDVMMPQMQTVKSGPQTISMKMSDIKINEGVSEEDFN